MVCSLNCPLQNVQILSIWKSKMATTADNSLTYDPIGKWIEAFFFLVETTNLVESKLYIGRSFTNFTYWYDSKIQDGHHHIWKMF